MNDHAQMVTGVHRVMKCAIVRKTAQNVIQRTVHANAVQVTLENNVTNFVRRVHSVVTVPNCASVARVVRDVILSPDDVCVSLAITGRRVIKVWIERN